MDDLSKLTLHLSFTSCLCVFVFVVRCTYTAPGESATNKHTTSAVAGVDSAARSLNQLFGGDSRFVINGSSLQIRSPSKRYDEAVYVCCLPPSSPTLDLAAAAAAGSGQDLGYTQQQQHAKATDLRRLSSAVVHQSSLAPPSAGADFKQANGACDSLLDATLFRELANQAGGSGGGHSPMSSISIRIVGKYLVGKALGIVCFYSNDDDDD